ncbi:MAG: ATP-binding cassette domain-containing protein [Clostridia bacterium]|nr:ATP-binding cassette domain-containing protein [Clostridia bacterium]
MLFNWLGALPGAAAQGMVWGIMAIGLYVTYKILDIADLTVDGSICTGGAVCAVLVTNGVNVWLAMLVAMLAGMLAGLVTGVLHKYMGIPAILAGILTQLILWSVNLKIMGKANIALPVRNYKLLLAQIYTGKSLLVLAGVIIVLIGVLYWFFGTELGTSLRATGSNQNMSRAQGINTDITSILGLVISNGIVAFSGALLAQYQGFADINMGRGAIVIGLAAVIIGEAIMSKFSSNFAAKLAGVILGGVFQDPLMGTAAGMMIEENLALAMRRGKHRGLRWGITKAERAEYVKMLASLDLGLETRLTSKVGLLSGGQRQAVTLLMASLNQPKLLLLDEHTAAASAEAIAGAVLEITDRIVTENRLTTVMITHNMKDAIAHGNRLIMLHEGHVIVDVEGEEKKKLTVEDLLTLFSKASGREFVSDRAMLS